MSQDRSLGGSSGVGMRGRDYYCPYNRDASSQGARTDGLTVENSEENVSDLLSHVSQLQKKIRELSQQALDRDALASTRWQPTSAVDGGPEGSCGLFGAEDAKRKVVMVNNLPLNLANCDSVYYMMEKFGTVERVKILHNKRSTALVQMQTPEMAGRAVMEQESLKRPCTGTEHIFINLATKVDRVTIPSEQGLTEDGLTKDYSDSFVGQVSAQSQSEGRQSSGGNGPAGQAPTDRALREARDASSIIGNGPCLLVSGLPAELANCDALCNLFGFYGDVQRVKILRNKPDCGLVQMCEPHQALVSRNYLDHLEVGGRKICVSFSRMISIKLPAADAPEDSTEATTKDYTNNVRRFRKPGMASKRTKNLCFPTSVLHVANLAADFTNQGLKEFFVSNGFKRVKEIVECGEGMALVQFESVEEAVKALAKLHNRKPEALATRNKNGLCLSFSSRKFSDSPSLKLTEMDVSEGRQ